MITISRICAAAAIAFAAPPALAKPGARTIHVPFKNGATEATVKGGLKGSAVINYVFSARTGETVTISLKTEQPSLGFVLTAPQDHELTFHASEFKGVAPLDGDYKVSVLFLRSDAKRNPVATYTLTISHMTPEPPAEPE